MKKLITHPMFKGVLTKIPILGSVVGEVLNDNTTRPGRMNREQLTHHLIKLVIYSALIYWLKV